MSERTREFGVRLALGARPFVVGRSIVLRMLWVAMPALVVGGAAGVLLTPFPVTISTAVTITTPATVESREHATRSGVFRGTIPASNLAERERRPSSHAGAIRPSTSLGTL